MFVEAINDFKQKGENLAYKDCKLLKQNCEFYLT